MDFNGHNRIARMFMQSMGMNVTGRQEAAIAKINHDIDNPNIWQMQLNRMQNQRYKNNNLMIQNPYDLFGLTRGGGHRTYNHDMLTGTIIGAMNARAMGIPFSTGLLTAYSHYAADNFSNHLVKSMGVDGKNVFNALMNWNLRKMQQRRELIPTHDG